MTCCDGSFETSGIPAVPPPCTSETCSVGFLPLNETGGGLGPFVKVVGGLLSPLVKKLSAGQVARPGLLRHHHDADGNCLGLGVDLSGRPDPVTVSCSNYQNPVREIDNGDGTFSLGGLPLPFQGRSCVGGVQACGSLFPAGVTGEIYGVSVDGGCGPDVTATVTNEGCWPLSVVPVLTITDASLGAGPVTMVAETNVNESGWGSPMDVFSSLQGTVTVLAGGAGDTGLGGAQPDHTHEIPDHADTSSAGGHAHQIGQQNTENSDPDNHNHQIPGQNTNQAGAHTHTLADHGDTLAGGGFGDHLHTIPDHDHQVEAFTGRASYSGSIHQPAVTVQPGETLTYQARTSIRYDADVTEPGELNFGSVTLCLDYLSEITPTTIAALTTSTV